MGRCLVGVMIAIGGVATFESFLRVTVPAQWLCDNVVEARDEDVGDWTSAGDARAWLYQ